MNEGSSGGKKQELTQSDVSRLLARWNEEGPDVAGEVATLLIEELRGIAAGLLARERSGHTLQPTALVNELYLRLLDRKQVTWRDRSHFLSFAARTVRRILVDHARRRRADKRLGDRDRIDLESRLLVALPKKVEILDLDRALVALEVEDPRLARVVELHYFAGFTVSEIAEDLGVGSATVKRAMRSARAFLFHWLKRNGLDS